MLGAVLGVYSKQYETHTYIYIYHTIWLFNVAMENQHVLLRKSTCLSSMCMGHGFHVG